MHSTFSIQVRYILNISVLQNAQSHTLHFLCFVEEFNFYRPHKVLTKKIHIQVIHNQSEIKDNILKITIFVFLWVDLRFLLLCWFRIIDVYRCEVIWNTWFVCRPSFYLLLAALCTHTLWRRHTIYIFVFIFIQTAYKCLYHIHRQAPQNPPFLYGFFTVAFTPSVCSYLPILPFPTPWNLSGAHRTLKSRILCLGVSLSRSSRRGRNATATLSTTLCRFPSLSVSACHRHRRSAFSRLHIFHGSLNCAHRSLYKTEQTPASLDLQFQWIRRGAVRSSALSLPPKSSMEWLFFPLVCCGSFIWLYTLAKRSKYIRPSDM